ncbi:MAG: LCP family protein [Dehalococcoidia bacterium]
MATIAQAATFPRTRFKARAIPRYTIRDRLLFVVALLTFGVAVFYMAGGLLIRAYPALFPGETVPFIGKVLSPLPGPVGVNQPGASSVFNKRVNLLILGLDKRPGDRFEDAYRTDTIMVATIDPVSKEASLLSFPRDLYITYDLPDGQWSGRINQSYLEGFQREGTIAAGAKQLAHDLEFNFGITIDHWMVMDFLGVEGIIDSIGGIDIDIPEELAVYNWWYSDEGGRPPEYVTFYPGEQHLIGYYAVAFGRSRESSQGDLDRVKRQQLVVEAALTKVFSLSLLNDPIGLYNAYKDTVKHDVAAGEMPGLARLLQASRGNLQTYSIADPVDGNPTVYGFETAGGAAVLGWDPENVTYWLNKAFPKTSYSGAAVEIQDGFGEPMEDRDEALGRYLRFAKGVPVVYIGPERTTQATTTITLFREGRRELAVDIAGWMGIPTAAIITKNPPDESYPDVLIAIGQDFILPDK